jgi:hypothetical protein
MSTPPNAARNITGVLNPTKPNSSPIISGRTYTNVRITYTINAILYKSIHTRLAVTLRLKTCKNTLKQLKFCRFGSEISIVIQKRPCARWFKGRHSNEGLLHVLNGARQPKEIEKRNNKLRVKE